MDTHLSAGNLEAKTVPRLLQGSAGPMKFLIRWTLVLGQQELQMMSGRPEVLQKVLDHVNTMIKGSKMEIYRIVSMEEVTRSVRAPREGISQPTRPTGIAIAEAGSVEEVRSMMQRLMAGISFGGLPVRMENYLEFEINPLMEIAHGGKV